MILKIRTEGDPVLRMKAKPVTQIDDTMRKLASDMLETMYDAPGIGLAAIQIAHHIGGAQRTSGGVCRRRTGQYRHFDNLRRPAPHRQHYADDYCRG